MQNCQEVWVLPTDPPSSGDSVNVSILDTVTIHRPDSEHRDVYPRVVEMPNGNLIASFVEAPADGWGHNPARIYRSTNGGITWSWISDLTDTHRSQGIADPELFVMPVTMGTVPEGTLLAAVRSMYFVSASYMDLYRSDDGGESWSFMSSVAAGTGYAETNVYEPFLMVDDLGRLLYYYTDERDGGPFKDKIVYHASADGGYTWGNQVEVVDTPDPDDHMGMVRIAKMDNGQYIMTYEANFSSPGPGVYYKLSNDGANWGLASDQGTRIVAGDGTVPHATPSVMWTPAGSDKGTVIVSSYFQTPASPRGSDNFVNYNYGAGPWYRVQQPIPYNAGVANAGYSRSVTPSSDGNTLYHITDADFTNDNVEIIFSATPTTFTRGYVYKIVNKDSRMVLSIQNGSTADGADATQETDNYTDDQKWAILDADEGGPQDYVKIVNKKSKKVLDIQNGSTADGADAIQWPSNTSSSQLWEVMPTGDGFYNLKNVNSGKLLGVTGCSPDPGTVADQWSDNGAACQNWQLQVIGLVVDE